MESGRGGTGRKETTRPGASPAALRIVEAEASFAARLAALLAGHGLPCACTARPTPWWKACPLDPPRLVLLEHILIGPSRFRFERRGAA